MFCNFNYSLRNFFFLFTLLKHYKLLCFFFRKKKVPVQTIFGKFLDFEWGTRKKVDLEVEIRKFAESLEFLGEL